MASKTKSRPRPASPASNGTPADPIADLHRKIRDAGFRFSTEHRIRVTATDFRTTLDFAVIVDTVIATRHDWLGMRESADRSWSSALCGPDLIVATCVRERYRPESRMHSHWGDTDTDPDVTRAIQRVRDALLCFLEGRPDTKWLELTAGGNGEGRIQVQFTEDADLPGVTIDLGLSDG
jgi:hypothetical protein